MAIAIAAVAFAACEKEPAFLADLKLPETATGNKMVVDAWANEFPLEIKTEGEWRIESDSYFFAVVPEEGTGNATVKVLVQNNTRNQRKTGHFTIVFPGHEEQNKTLTIEQKWQGECDENAGAIKKSNEIYAIGFSYDATNGLYANPDNIKKEVFNTNMLLETGKESIGAVQMKAVLSTVTGSSISEISNKLTAKANASGGFGRFKAEANTTFDMNYTNNSNHEYAINCLEATMFTAKFTLSTGWLKTQKYMTEEAYADINGIILYDYATDNPDGLANLIREYGTHVLMTARLGGRVRQALDVDITNITTAYDLNVFAKASYEGIFTAGGEVKDDFHKSFNDHKDEMKITVEALGGDAGLAQALVKKDGFTEANYQAWLKSVKEQNMALMGFVDNQSLIPLYELVDQNATKEKDGFDGKERYNALRTYMTGEEMAKKYEDNSTYDSGTVTAFDVPSFSGWDHNRSLVQDIMLGGQRVGIVCEEYIPIIDMNKRVTVVYPVIGSSVRYNMGFFIGDADHKPARVAWNGTNTNISEIPDSTSNFGRATKLYLRGSTIITTPLEDIDTRQGLLQDHKISAMGRGLPTEYPVVKIFNQLWMRKNFESNLYTNGGRINCKYNDGNPIERNRNAAFYSYEEASNANFAPSGWRVTSKNDFTDIKGLLEAKGVTHISAAKAFFTDNFGGVLGFHEEFCGGWQHNNPLNTHTAGYYGCLNAKRQYESVCAILMNEQFDPGGQSPWDNDNRFTVRLVKKLF